MINEQLSMKKLKVAFLWHQHQPYYKIDNEFILPWVLLHGTKDYFDIPEVLYEFPNIKQTFNFAPSLSLQLDEYISGKAKDRVQILTAIRADELTPENKSEIIRIFFHSNYENMISPYPRYKDLYHRAQDKNQAITGFEVQDWLDIQVWYNLSWFGFFSKQSGIPRRLVEKGSGFTELEKQSLQEEQNVILRKINLQYRKLSELGQIELSCSPMYHPIVPLLINSGAAKESKPNQKLPEPIFNFPEDASLQIKSGLEYFKNTFGIYPQGVWPSEGSVSDDTLKLMIDSGIQWVATDEQVLMNSMTGTSFSQTEKFFPRNLAYENGEISVFFRDHFLSDRIGFVYSKWNEGDAVSDFMHHLRSIKSEIINNHGQDALDYACVSVILDGENCWEYYKDNGIPFLRALFRELSLSNDVETITFTQGLHGKSYLKPLNHICAGSWINGNFDIWIGHDDDIKAWNMLSNARHELRNNADKLSPESYRDALQSLMIAEGSDWFWWYGPEHQTVDKPDFDRIFRHYIIKAYSDMGITPPETVYLPIEIYDSANPDKTPISKLDTSNGINYLSYENSAFIRLKAEMSAMHRIGDFADSMNYGNDAENLFIKLNFSRSISTGFEIRLFFDTIGKDIYISQSTLKTDIDFVGVIRNSYFMTLIIPISAFDNHRPIQTRIETFLDGNLLKYPSSSSYSLEIV